MTDVRIGRLELRGRLPGGDARARLERVAAEACGELLERALERAGVADDGELCIRSLDVPARLPFHAGDGAAAAAWSERVAESARAAVEAGGPGVVRYESTAQAFLDVVSSAARGDFGRAWAWRQLGLWSGGDDLRGLAAALRARPELSVAALGEAARQGALVPLLRALPGEAWAGVALAALGAAGAGPALLDPLSPAGPRGRSGAATARASAAAGTTGGAGETEAAAAALSRARQVAASSRLFAAALRGGALGLSPLTRRALAALALVESDPGALRGPHAAAILAALDGDLAARAGGGGPRTAAGRAERGSRDPRPAAEATTGATGDEAAARREPAREAETTPDADGARAVEQARHAEAPPDAGPGDGARGPARGAPRPTQDGREDGVRTRTRDAARVRRDTATPRDTPPALDGDDAGAHAARPETARDTRGTGGDHEEGGLEPAWPEAESEPPVARQRRTTRFGGLLFLLHLVDGLHLQDGLSEAAALRGRPLRFSLHRLALALLRELAGFDDAADDDPAALAFAGLRPLDAPPDGGGAPLGDEERRAIAAAALRVAPAAAERLRETDTLLCFSPAAAEKGVVAPPHATPPRDADPPPSAGGAEWRVVLRELVARRAEIVADPGWFEVRLALDEVDTRVRRAGLDLDPGHLPWLGAVVKFRYA